MGSGQAKEFRRCLLLSWVAGYMTCTQFLQHEKNGLSVSEVERGASGLAQGAQLLCLGVFLNKYEHK